MTIKRRRRKAPRMIPKLLMVVAATTTTGCLCLFPQPAVAVSYVIDPFESKLPVTGAEDGGGLDLSLSTDALFGEMALRAGLPNDNNNNNNNNNHNNKKNNNKKEEEIAKLSLGYLNYHFKMPH